MPRVKHFVSNEDGITLDIAGDNPTTLAAAIKDFGNAVSKRRGLTCTVTRDQVHITIKVPEGERSSVDDFVRARVKQFF